MMALVTVRQIRPGSYEDFRKAWEPDPWWPQLSRLVVLRNDDNPDEVMTVGYFDISADELEQLRDSPEVLKSEAERLERIAPYEERLIINGIFEVAEELSPPA